MGLRGPKAKSPPAAKGKADPQAPPEPSWLTPPASAKWRELVPELHAVGLLTRLDGDALASYCQTWADYLAAVAEIARSGLLTRRGTGALFANPAIAIARSCQVVLGRLGSSLGLTTEARARLRLATADPYDDPLGRFLNRMD